MKYESRHQWLQHTVLVGRVMVFVFACAFMLAVLNPVMSRFSGTQKSLAVGTIAAVGVFVLTILFTRWDSLQLAAVGANIERRSPARFVIGFGIGSAIIGLWAIIIYAAGYVHWERAIDTGYQSVVVSLLVFFVLACREELAFHGYPLRRLQMSWGVWPSQFVIAALFAIEHILGGASWIDAVVGSALGSLLFGIASIATEGLAVPIGLHAAWNTGHWALGFKSMPGLLRPVGQTDNERAAYIVAMTSYALVITLATLIFWLWYRNRCRHIAYRFSNDSVD